MDMITLAMAKGYTDSQRLGYVEPTEVIFDSALNQETDTFGYYWAGNEDLNSNPLVAGQTYTVITNRGSFTSVCKDAGAGHTWLGNGKDFGLGDTGESFFVACFYENGYALVAMDYNNGTRIKVTTPETIHTIDPKFLPNGGFGYVEPGKLVLDIALTDGSNFEDFEVTGNELKAGETYTVITESGSFSAVCKGEDGNILYMGNAWLADPDEMENTGESFCVVLCEDFGHWAGVAIDANGGSFIKVSTTETIHKIDPKYLPGAVLPVVELSTISTGEDSVSLATDEGAMLDAAWENDSPIVVKFLFGEIPVTATLNRIDVGVARVYGQSCFFGEMTIRVALMSPDGSWSLLAVAE